MNGPVVSTPGGAVAFSGVPHFHIMTKPIGPICNLDCKYCFYLEKEQMYPETRGAGFRMTDAMLETYVRDYIAHQAGPEISFAWQGGEPTLMGVEFFERVVALQRRHCPGSKRITNALQTNGTLLDDAWGEFLAREKFLVGVSIDGPRELHDRYRVDKGGRPTFDKVIEGLDLLKRYGVEFNTLTVVNRHNARHPAEVYRFLREHGSGFMQFIPLVERKGEGGGLAGAPDGSAEPEESVTHWSVGSRQFGDFLCGVWDEWLQRDVGRVFVQLFDVQLGLWMGLPSALCVFGETCGNALALEHNGDLYACDHFVYPEYRIGNIAEQSLGDMVRGAAQKKFGTDKRDTLPRFCRECEYRFACNGECPKHRFLATPDGEPGLNYLCAGYKRFFAHIDPVMRRMAAWVRSGRPASDLIPILAAERRGPGRPPSRNDPCTCGSGRKFKVCCGKPG